MTRARLLFIITTAIAVLLALPNPASAHRNDESYLYLDVGDRSLSGRVELPYPDLRSEFGFELEGTPDELRAEIESELDFLQTYAADETSIGVDGETWDMTFEGYELLFEESSGPNGLGYVVLPFVVDLTRSSVPQVLDVTFTPFLDEIDDRNNITLVANDWKRGVFDEETNELLLHTSGSPTGEVDLGDSSQWKNFRTSIDLGVDHIRTGPDHVFFVLALLLPAVLILVAGAWRPSPSFGYSLLRIVLVATMFTIAHSITFTLAGLDYLPLPPSKLVETIIALSIAAAALHNLRPVLGHREWLLAFVFGLFHGMGFAGLVESLDIDRSTQLVSLLGRNVGIEIAQLVIIFVTFPLLFVLRRTRIYMPLFYAISIGLAVLSMVWVVERIFELDLKVNRGVDFVLEWPRALYAMAALTLLAGAYYWWEDRHGRLLPCGERSPKRPTSDVDSVGDTPSDGASSHGQQVEEPVG